MSKIIVMKGLPASGKSTKAKELMELYGNFVRLNRDTLREMLHFGKFTGPNEGVTQDVQVAIARHLLAQQKNIIIDDTNLGKAHWDRWRGIATETGSKIELFEMPTNVFECMARDTKREASVGAEVIMNMALKYGIWQLDKPVVICDLDGTLCNVDHRLHFVNCKFIEGPHNPDGTCHKKDWKGFYSGIADDPVNQNVLDMLRAHTAAGRYVVFVSGRPETYKAETLKWLYEHYGSDFLTLMMRRANDSKPDDEVKEDILNAHFPDKSKIVEVIDDRPRVIRMWERNGLKVVDVGPGIEF